MLLIILLHGGWFLCLEPLFTVALFFGETAAGLCLVLAALVVVMTDLPPVGAVAGWCSGGSRLGVGEDGSASELRVDEAEAGRLSRIRPFPAKAWHWPLERPTPPPPTDPVTRSLCLMNLLS